MGGADVFEGGLPVFGGGGGAEADLFEILGEFLFNKIEDFLGFRRAGGIFDASVNVFGVFAEDDHVDFFRGLHGRGHAGEVAHGAEADVEVEELAEGDVEGADAAADG